MTDSRPLFSTQFPLTMGKVNSKRDTYTLCSPSQTESANYLNPLTESLANTKQSSIGTILIDELV
jgi:hypothetical protein